MRWPRRQIVLLLFPVLFVILSGCARYAGHMPAKACPDLTGSWTSAVFQPLKVFTDGSREIQAPTSTTLKVVHQEGCTFQAVNSWSSGKLGGSEQVAGTIGARSGMITMTEIGPHPKGGSSALILARLVAENKMTWEYVGLADDDSMGQVFITGLHRGATPPERAGCPDLTGRWTSAVFQPLNVYADGSREIPPPTSTTLDVVYQKGCTFAAVNNTSDGQPGGSEQVVGTISGETGMITMAEIGPHPKGGSSGLIIARQVAKDQMTWEYVGLTDNDTMGQVFITKLGKK